MWVIDIWLAVFNTEKLYAHSVLLLLVGQITILNVCGCVGTSVWNGRAGLSLLFQGKNCKNKLLIRPKHRILRWNTYILYTIYCYILFTNIKNPIMFRIKTFSSIQTCLYRHHGLVEKMKYPCLVKATTAFQQFTLLI